MVVLGEAFKMILLTLLIIALLVVALLLVICLAPVKYDIYFAKYEETTYEIHFSYLWGIRGSFTKEQGKMSAKIKAFWKTLYEVPSKSQDERVKKQPPKKQPLEKQTGASMQSRQKPQMNEEVPLPKTQVKEAVVKEKVKEESAKKQVEEKTTQEEPIQEEPNKAQPQQGILSNYSLILKLIKLTGKILKVILPRTWDFEVIIGKGDPADTGECIAKLIMFYPLYYRHGIIRGDYERECLEGGFLAEGRFRVGTLIWLLTVFLIDRTNRQGLADLLKEIK